MALSNSKIELYQLAASRRQRLRDARDHVATIAIGGAAGDAHPGIPRAGVLPGGALDVGQKERVERRMQRDVGRNPKPTGQVHNTSIDGHDGPTASGERCCWL